MTIRYPPGYFDHHLLAIPPWTDRQHIVASSPARPHAEKSSRMTPREVPRAPRYAVHVALRYRQGVGLPWLHGRTEDVSSSGVLFVADAGDRSLDVNTQIEMTGL